MSRRNEWKEKLAKANEDIKQYNLRLVITENDGCYDLSIFGPGTKDFYGFAQNYYEDELVELIYEAWAHARIKGLQAKRPRQRGEFNSERIAEVVYDITTVADPLLFNYIEDSRERFSLIWGWAMDFEHWWNDLLDEERDEKDYLSSVEDYAAARAREAISTQTPAVFNTKLADMCLSVRAYNTLVVKGDIQTVGELCSFRRIELMRLRHFGRKTLQEIDLLIEKLHLAYDSAPMVPRLSHLYWRR